MGFRIEQNPQTVLSYVTAIQSAADAEREALGFMPGLAYEQAARNGEITLLLREEGVPTYAGHVWVSGTYPHARVVQLCVLPCFRGEQLSSRLLRSAIQSAEAQGYLSMKANVASDLHTANRVYQSHGFEHVRSRPGGRSRGREILVRSKELSSPSLFNYSASKAALLDGPEASLQDQPLYILDMNVFFDVLRQRRSSASAARIISAALAGEVRVGVTTEFVKELQRTAKENDPVLAFARLLPVLTSPPSDQVAALVDSLALMVFPDQARVGVLSPQSRSDLHHLAEAILSGADGLITAEKAIIRADTKLRADHRFGVWGTDAFAALLPTFSEPLAPVRIVHDLLFRTEARGVEIDMFLRGHGVTDQVLASFRRRDATDKRFSVVGVRENGHLVAAALFEAPAGPVGHARLLIAGDNRHPAISTAADYLLEHHVRLAAASRPARVEFIEVEGQPIVRRAAIANGFLASGEGSQGLQKLVFGTAVTAEAWSECRKALRSCLNVELPAQVPSFEHDEQMIELTAEGRINTFSLLDLESVFSPALFVLPGRPAAIVPIQKVWADDLLGGAQLPLFPKPEAALRSRRVYFSSPLNAKTLVRGRPIIFHESGKGLGRSAAIAVARVSHAEIVRKDQAPEELLQAAVVRGGELARLTTGTTVLAVWFDNIMRFETPVPFSQMKALGVDDKTNLVRSRVIDSETASRIIRAGCPNAT